VITGLRPAFPSSYDFPRTSAVPYPPPRIPSGPRRRTLLASAAGAALLTGCSSSAGSSGGESAGGSPSVTERARARAARDSAGLLQRYDAVLVAHPTLAERLAPLRAEVVRHLEAFGGAPKASSSPSPSASTPSDSASLVPAPQAPEVPSDPKAALAGIAAAEKALTDARITALLDVPGELARLLASVAAAGSAHVYLLTEGAR
jgi:hypothetical protein